MLLGAWGGQKVDFWGGDGQGFGGLTFCTQHPKPGAENPMMVLTAVVSRFQSEQPLHAGREARVCCPSLLCDCEWLWGAGGL